MSKMTVSEYARHRNVSKNMVYKYLDEGAISAKSRIEGKPLRLDSERADADLAVNAPGASGGVATVPNDDDSLLYERTRLTRINADRKQLELQQARGELIRTEVAQKLWAAVMANINSKIEIIPQKLPPLAFGLSIPEIKALTERMIYEVRMEIANPDLEEISKAGSDTKRVDKSGKTTKNKSIGRSKNGKKKFKSH